MRVPTREVGIGFNMASLIEDIYARQRRRMAANGQHPQSSQADMPVAPAPAEPIVDSPGVQQITDQRRLREARIARSAALRTSVPSDPSAFAARASAIGNANDQIDTIQGISAPIQQVQSVSQIRGARANLSGQAVTEIERQMNERINSIRAAGGDPSADPELQRLAQARTKWGGIGMMASATDGSQMASSLSEAERVQVGQRKIAERQMARRGAYQELYGRMVQPEAIARGEEAANTNTARQVSAYDRIIAQHAAANAAKSGAAAGAAIPSVDEAGALAEGRMSAQRAQMAQDAAKAAQADLATAEATAQLPEVQSNQNTAALIRRAEARKAQQGAAFSMANIPDPGEWLGQAASLASTVRDTPNEENVRAFELGPLAQLSQIAANDPDGAEQLAIQLLNNLGLQPGESFIGQKNSGWQVAADWATGRPNRAANSTVRANRLVQSLTRFVRQTPKSIGYQALP